MKNVIVVLALSFATRTTAFGREVKFEKKVNPGELQSQLIAAGFKINYIECSGTRCKIVLPDSENKNPMGLVQKYIYEDPAEIRIKKIGEMRILIDKWDSGTISPEEKDLLIKNVLKMVLGPK